MRVRGIVWLILGIAPAALAGEAHVPAAYVTAAQAHSVPPTMLYALSLTESATTLSYGRRPWPWTLNVAGTPHRYKTRDAACGALRRSLKKTRVVDVGIAQLNVRWQRKLFGDGQRFADPCDALDPYANLDAAAGVLARCHGQHPDSWVDAAGCYHRPAGGAPAARYRRSIRRQLAEIGDVVTPAPDGGHSVATHHEPDSSKPAGHTVASANSRSVHAKRVTWINPTHEGDAHALD